MSDPIIEKFKEILYKELSVKPYNYGYYSSTYLVDKKDASNVNENSFILSINIELQMGEPAIIYIRFSNSSGKLIFMYHFDYNKIDQFLISSQKILQLINSKLSDPKTRRLYQKKGLVNSAAYTTDSKIINMDIKNQYHKIFDDPKKYNTIYSTSYMQTRVQFLFFKIIQLIRKYIKEEYKNKIYLEKNDVGIKILNTDKIILRLNVFRDNLIEDPKITIKLSIIWNFNLQEYDTERIFETQVGLVSTLNESDILDRFAKKSMIFFNELDDYVKLQPNWKDL